jgi:hypothetical protein
MKTLIINSKTYGRHEVFYDDEDHEKVSKHIWCVVPNRYTFYAMTRLIIGVKKYKTVRMHQLFVNSTCIDHKNGNGLDNRKENLRAATDGQNNFNQPITKRNKTGFKGVHVHNGKYVACIRVKGKLIHGGCFRSPIEAAKKYNELAIEHHKEFAWLNPL